MDTKQISPLIAVHFAHIADARRKNHQQSLGSYFLMSPSRLFHIAASLCCQLKTPLMDDADSKLMSQSIVFAVCGVHSVTGQTTFVGTSAFWSALEQQEKDRFLNALDLLDSRMGRSMFLPLTSVHEQNNQQSANNIQHVLVSILVRKMGKIALQMEAYQMGIVFNSFKSIISEISQGGDCLPYASEVLLPLYKVCEGFAGKAISDNLKQLAEETREKLQNTLGTRNFVHIYNLVGKKLKAKRVEKKQEEKVMAVINPMRNAKRKMRISAKNRANKKRKILTMKMARWMH